MNLPQTVDALTDKGFAVAIALDHRSIAVNLKNRKVGAMEVQMALGSRTPTTSTNVGVKIEE